MIRDALLALGVLLSTASQFRPEGAPLGPGEFCLGAWILLALCYEAHRLGPPSSPALLRLLIFWLLFALAQGLGYLMGLATEEFRDTRAAAHTMVAYLLMAGLSCFTVILPETGWRLRRVTWILSAVGAVALAVQLANACGLVSLPVINPWEWNRFRGWSENPNQMGLLASVLLLLSFHLAETAARPGARFLALVCAAPSFVAGVITKSDSFLLVVLIGGPMFVALKLWTSLFKVENRLSVRTAFACVIVLALPALLASAAPFAPSMADQAQKFATTTMAENDQAENRFKLWREAIDIGFDSWMLGLGPGPHLVQKQYKRPPPDKFEAHNTIFDLFTQGGWIAVLSFLSLLAMAFLVAYRAGRIALTTLVVTLFVFSNFHLIVRHPIFWFPIALCLAAGESVRRVNVDRNWSR